MRIHSDVINIFSECECYDVGEKWGDKRYRHFFFKKLSLKSLKIMFYNVIKIFIIPKNVDPFDVLDGEKS